MYVWAHFTKPLPAPHQGQSLHLLHLSCRALKAASFCMRSVFGFCIRLQTSSNSGEVHCRGSEVTVPPKVHDDPNASGFGMQSGTTSYWVMLCKLNCSWPGIGQADIVNHLHRCHFAQMLHDYLRNLRRSSTSSRTWEQVLQMHCRIACTAFR